MTPVRLTVAMLLGVIAFFAVALAALRSASVGWLLATFLLEWGMLLTVVTGTWFTRGPDRAPWIGALIFSGGLLMATTQNLFLNNTSNHLFRALSDIFEQMYPSPPMSYMPRTLTPEESFRRQIAVDLVTREHNTRQYRFTLIATSLLVIAFAAVGSYAGRAFAWRRQVAASIAPLESGTEAAGEVSSPPNR